MNLSLAVSLLVMHRPAGAVNGPGPGLYHLRNSPQPDHHSAHHTSSCLCVPCLQNLRYAKLHLWVGNYSNVYNANTKPFFNEFKQYIEIRQFDYKSEVVGTPFAGDPFFGNSSSVRKHIPALGAYSDIVRLLLLHNYGGEDALQV